MDQRVECVTFEEALADTSTLRRNLLLGNGFSIAVHEAFGYQRLYEEAVSREPSLASLFPPNDNNFEAALDRNSGDPAAITRIKAALIRSVAEVHPEHALKLGEAEARSCRDFLEPFVGRSRAPRGTVFTTNYDLLLHWVVSKQGKNPGTKQFGQLQFWDGFDGKGLWVDSVGLRADAWYLHGAVHIFQYSHDYLPPKTWMLRYSWQRPLKKQVQARLAAGHLPAFIAEGDSQRKKSAQYKWEYLKAAKAKLKRVLKERDSVLFTFGHSFGPSDNHIAEAIAAGTVRTIYIGTFDGKGERRAQELANYWHSERAKAGLPGVEVYRYPSSAPPVWTKYNREAATARA